MSRLLAVDLGERRIGLAFADELDGIVRPLATIRRGSAERDADVIGRIAAEHGVDTIVVGLPSNMDGSEGSQAMLTRDWAAKMSTKLDLPVCWRDERLTSIASEAALGPPARGRSGGPPSRAANARRRAQVDREAARRILQAELDARAGVRR